MGIPFEIFGPFEVDKHRVANKAYQKTFWSERDEGYPKLSDANGVYLFSLRNGANYNPQYVGITKRDFKREVFNNNNLVKILDLCVPKTLSTLMRWQNRLSWRNDWIAVFIPCSRDRAMQVEEPD